MKKIMIAFIAIVALVSVSNAQEMGGDHKGMHMPTNFRAVPMAKAQLLQKGDNKMFCPKCGMNLPMFYRTNFAAKVDGKVEQFCSMHCLVEEMKSGKKVEDIQVVDNSTLKFIPAKDAYFVVGSSKPATMSKISKYAFGTKEAAEEFSKKFGGKVMRFDDALKIAKEAYDKEAQMISHKQSMMAKKGKELYEANCKKIDKKFNSTAEAKSYIKSNNICPTLRGKALQAVGLYLSGH